jgi:hypothetical protein
VSRKENLPGEVNTGGGSDRVFVEQLPGTDCQPGREVLTMGLSFFADPLKIATVVFSVFFLVCILAALCFQERNITFELPVLPLTPDPWCVSEKQSQRLRYCSRYLDR